MVSLGWLWGTDGAVVEYATREYELVCESFHLKGGAEGGRGKDSSGGSGDGGGCVCVCVWGGGSPTRLLKILQGAERGECLCFVRFRDLLPDQLAVGHLGRFKMKQSAEQTTHVTPSNDAALLASSGGVHLNSVYGFSVKWCSAGNPSVRYQYLSRASRRAEDLKERARGTDAMPQRTEAHLLAGIDEPGEDAAER